MLKNRRTSPASHMTGEIPSLRTFTFNTICYDDPPHPQRALDVFPHASPMRRLPVLFVHGGGWNGGSRTIFHPIMYALSREGWLCGSLDYRLSQCTAKDQLRDVRLGRELFTQGAADVGCAGKVVLVGSSAGAHLALMDALTDRQQQVAGVVAVSAPLSFEPWEEMFPPIWASMCRIAGAAYEDQPERYRDLSPLRHVDERTPAICLMDGANEHMFPAHLAKEFIAAMQSKGREIRHHVYDHAEHGFFYDVTRPCQQKAYADLVNFLKHLESLPVTA